MWARSGLLSVKHMSGAMMPPWLYRFLQVKRLSLWYQWIVFGQNYNLRRSNCVFAWRRRERIFFTSTLCKAMPTVICFPPLCHFFNYVCVYNAFGAGSRGRRRPIRSRRHVYSRRGELVFGLLFAIFVYCCHIIDSIFLRICGGLLSPHSLPYMCA